MENDYFKTNHELQNDPFTINFLKKRLFLLTILLFFIPGINLLKAQTASTSDNLIATPKADRVVPFDVSSTGISKTVEFGADLAWANEQAFRRNILFMGLDQIDLVRASFQPTYPLVNGTDLTQEQLDDLNYRLSLIETYVGPNTNLALNCDHAYNETTGRYTDEWYVGFPERWEQLIAVSTQMYLDAGHNVITVGAFNEPDYGWDQGSADDMYNITALLKSNPLFDGMRLSGGNTLNCDEAQGWYDFLIPAGVNEGNTHQLAGSFDGYASFYQNVRANGHHATADELHNIVEALVGYEYGMQTGVWWADIDLASGEMVKAFDGERLGYAEHRPNWTAAAVYRAPSGKVQAFGGTSERQAVTTTYNYISKDRSVYYDGEGPQREFVLEMPGGLPGSYGDGQTNAERVINITYGDDIQPEINGNYVLVNRASGQVLAVTGSTSQDGANVAQASYSGSTSQQWNVYPVDSRVGGDFSYFKIQPLSNNRKFLDLSGFSLDNGANIHQWAEGQYGNQQWYLDYSEDNWFYIRSRESSHCLAVDGTGNVIQWEKDGSLNQQWRLVPVGIPLEFNAPNAPTNLTATANEVSIKLEWTANSESDLAGYDILRAESANGEYNTIARKVTSNSFVDNTSISGRQYFYKIRAEDNSLNRSDFSNEISATTSGEDALVTNYSFEGNLFDTTLNLNHSASFNSASFTGGQVDSQALSLNGSDDFLQLPPDIASHQEITVATWINWNGGGNWQRIFDFGNGTEENLFLTTNNTAGQLQFSISGNTGSINLNGPALEEGVWKHVAITLGSSGVKMYVDGQLVAETTANSVSPLDFRPVQNYIGRSHYPDPALNASVDDFRVYNYPLTAAEIAALAGAETCSPTEITAYYQINGGTWEIGREITINEGDQVGFGPQPLEGGSWSWDGCNISGTSREQFVTLNNSCAVTATYTNDCGGVSNVTYNVTVNPVENASSMYVESITTGTQGAGKGLKYATAGVLVLDNNGNPVSGAAVNGTFYGGISEAASGVTGSDGWVYFQTSGTAKGKFTVDFCVDGINHPVLSYDSAQNQITCTGGISSATSRTVAAETSVITAYPNPTSDYVILEAGDSNANMETTVFDMSGTALFSKTLNSKDNSIDLSSLQPGIYLIEVKIGSVIETKKIIKE